MSNRNYKQTKEQKIMRKEMEAGEPVKLSVALDEVFRQMERHTAVVSSEEGLASIGNEPLAGGAWWAKYGL